MPIDLVRTASKIGELPWLARVSPSVDRAATTEELEGYRKSQDLARRAVKAIAQEIQEGWTEKEAAALLNEYLRDCGVKAFFHEAFAWFGERTRFDGISRYWHFQPTRRCLREGEVFLLDVAPIVGGYVCDIGYSDALGESPALEQARATLRSLRAAIPSLFDREMAGEDIWHTINERIREAGYDPVHRRYPFEVVGHRVHRVAEHFCFPVLNFGWQSYWSIASRGIFSQLLNGAHHGRLTGLWAIEPHLGGKGFGAKFEEILVVPSGGKNAYWLDPQPFGLGEAHA